MLTKASATWPKGRPPTVKSSPIGWRLQQLPSGGEMEIRISFCSRGFNSTSTTWLFQSSGPTNLITALWAIEKGFKIHPSNSASSPSRRCNRYGFNFPPWDSAPKWTSSSPSNIRRKWTSSNALAPFSMTWYHSELVWYGLVCPVKTQLGWKSRSNFSVCL